MNTKLANKVVLKDKDVPAKTAKNIKGGRAASAPAVSEIVVTKVTDSASPKLF